MADSFFYKNKEDFIQPVTVDGKRYIINPGMTVRVGRKLDLDIYTFLEKVEATPHASELVPLKTRKKIPGATKEAVEGLAAELEVLRKQITTLPKREDISQFLNDALAKTPQIEQAELNNMVDDVQQLKAELENIADNTQIDDLVNQVNNMESKVELTLKRLDIIKQAFQNFESVMYDTIIADTDDEPIVINDDENGQ